MGFKGTVRVFEINKTGAPQPEAPLFTITNNGSKPTVAAWTALDQYIVTGHENGTLNLWDMVSPALLLSSQSLLIDLIRYRRESCSVTRRRGRTRSRLPIYKCRRMELGSSRRQRTRPPR